MFGPGRGVGRVSGGHRCRYRGRPSHEVVTVLRDRRRGDSRTERNGSARSVRTRNGYRTAVKAPGQRVGNGSSRELRQDLGGFESAVFGDFAAADIPTLEGVGVLRGRTRRRSNVFFFAYRERSAVDSVTRAESDRSRIARYRTPTRAVAVNGRLYIEIGRLIFAREGSRDRRGGSSRIAVVNAPTVEGINIILVRGGGGSRDRRAVDRKLVPVDGDRRAVRNGSYARYVDGTVILVIRLNGYRVGLFGPREMRREGRFFVDARSGSYLVLSDIPTCKFVIPLVGIRGRRSGNVGLADRKNVIVYRIIDVARKIVNAVYVNGTERIGGIDFDSRVVSSGSGSIDLYIVYSSVFSARRSVSYYLQSAGFCGSKRNFFESSLIGAACTETIFTTYCGKNLYVTAVSNDVCGKRGFRVIVSDNAHRYFRNIRIRCFSLYRTGYSALIQIAEPQVVRARV